MRRFLLCCVLLAALVVATAAGAGASASAKPGYLVVRRAVSDGGVNGSPAVTVVVRGGFVLGRVSQQAKVEVYHLGSASNQLTPQVKGDVSSTSRRWHGLPGRQYNGSNFRFRVTGGFYRVVVRGSGIYVFAGGRGTVWLQGSSVNPHSDGTYSIDGSRPRSMPTLLVKRQIGRG